MYGLTMELPKIEFQVRKNNFAETRIMQTTALPLGDGQARLRLDPFAMTSNNIMYAAMGEGELGYWDFFRRKTVGHGRLVGGSQRWWRPTRNTWPLALESMAIFRSEPIWMRGRRVPRPTASSTARSTEDPSRLSSQHSAL